MQHEPTAPRPAPLQSIQPYLNLMVVCLALGGGLFTALTALTGGFTLKNQSAMSDLDQKVSQIQVSVDKLQARLDTMPRPSDYTAQETHLSRLDNALAEMRDRVATDEAISAGVKARVDRLEAGTNAPIRIPR